MKITKEQLKNVIKEVIEEQKVSISGIDEDLEESTGVTKAEIIKLAYEGPLTDFEDSLTELRRELVRATLAQADLDIDNEEHWEWVDGIVEDLFEYTINEDFEVNTVEESNGDTKSLDEIRSLLAPLQELQTDFEDASVNISESDFEKLIMDFEESYGLDSDLVELIIFGRGDLDSLADFVHYNQTGTTGVSEAKDLLDNLDEYTGYLESLLNKVK